MKQLMLGSAIGLMAGVGLMMGPMAKAIRRDVRMGMNKARKLMRSMERR